MTREVKTQAGAAVRGYIRCIGWVVLLTVIPWAPVRAQGEASLPPKQNSGQSTDQALEKHITASFRTAPVSVFMSALLVNTGLDLEIDESVDVLISGDFTGTFEEVLERVSRSYSLMVVFDQSTVRISNRAINVSPLKTALETVPGVTPEITAEVTPDAKPDITAEVTPDAKPDITAEVTPDATPEVTAEVTAEIAPQTTVSRPTPSLKSTPNSTPKVQTKKRQPRRDEFVDRIFILNNVRVADSTLNDSRRTVIPGAVSQLKQLMSNLGAQDFQYRGVTAQQDTADSVSIVPVASINAVKVRDRVSTMALYRDLIESIDASSVSASSGLEWTTVK